MRMASSLSAACMAMGFLVFTRSTLMPLESMGVMTMKMMSMTSITSTMGVTLMSEIAEGAFFFFLWSTGVLLYGLVTGGALPPPISRFNSFAAAAAIAAPD